MRVTLTHNKFEFLRNSFEDDRDGGFFNIVLNI